MKKQKQLTLKQILEVWNLIGKYFPDLSSPDMKSSDIVEFTKKLLDNMVASRDGDSLVKLMLILSNYTVNQIFSMSPENKLYELMSLLILHKIYLLKLFCLQVGLNAS